MQHKGRCERERAVNELKMQSLIKGTDSWRLNVGRTALSGGAAKALPPSLSRTKKILAERWDLGRVRFFSYICAIPSGTNYCVLPAD